MNIKSPLPQPSERIIQLIPWQNILIGLSDLGRVYRLVLDTNFDNPDGCSWILVAEPLIKAFRETAYSPQVIPDKVEEALTLPVDLPPVVEEGKYE